MKKISLLNGCLWLIFLVFLIFECHTTAVKLITLTQAQEYAKKIHTIWPNNNDLFFPEYTTWYRHKASHLQRFWDYVSASPFRVSACKAIIKEIVRHSETQCEASVGQLPHKPGEKIAIVGDLQGDFVSCVHDLTAMYDRHIISEDLTIIDPSYRIIFNANVIGREPYNLELLTLVASIILKNPNRVWFNRGKYEERDFWTMLPLYQHLDAFNERVSDRKESLQSLLERWFMTLPYAIYISFEHGKKLIRISGYGRDFKLLNERSWGTFFDKPVDSAYASYCINKTEKSLTIPHVRSLIYSNDGIDEFVQNKGLALIDWFGGAIAWTVFSAPTALHKAINHFHYDAFAVLELASNFEATTITLFNHDVNNDSLFRQADKFVLATGQRLKPDMVFVPHSTTNKLGSCVDLSKGSSLNGQSLKTGLSVAFNGYNQNKPLSLKPIELFIRDSMYNSTVTQQAIEEFQQNGIDTVITLQGSRNLETVSDKLKDGSMLFLFPTSGATIFRNASLPGVIHGKVSYRDEVFALIPHLVEQKLIKRFAFFYQNNSFGISAMEAAREILTYYGIKKWSEFPYEQNIIDINNIAEKIKKEKPVALGLFADTLVSIALLKAIGTSTIMDMTIFGLDALCEGLFINFTQRMGIKPLLTHTVPDPENSSLNIVQEYRKAMDAAGKPYGDFSLEAFISANLYIDALQKIKEPLSHISLRTYFEHLNAYAFKGLVLSFDPQSRSLMHDLWMAEGTGVQVKLTNPEKAFKKQHAQ